MSGVPLDIMQDILANPVYYKDPYSPSGTAISIIFRLPELDGPANEIHAKLFVKTLRTIVSKQLNDAKILDDAGLSAKEIQDLVALRNAIRTLSKFL